MTMILQPKPFSLPDQEGKDRATYEQEVEGALAAMNAVPMTVDQLERGYEAYVMGSLATGGRHGEKLRMFALRAFCRAEGLLPADVAAEAVLYRYRWILDAWENCVDLKSENPAFYEGLATGPVDPFWLEYVEYDDEDEDDGSGGDVPFDDPRQLAFALQ